MTSFERKGLGWPFLIMSDFTDRKNKIFPIDFFFGLLKKLGKQAGNYASTPGAQELGNMENYI